MMISNLNTLEVLGAYIDGESQVDMILQSLLESFKEFRLNYNINKKGLFIVWIDEWVSSGGRQG